MSENGFLTKFKDYVREACKMDNDLFELYDVKRGLRNSDRTGVLVGLTNIGDVVGYEKKEGKIIPVPGRLLYRGIDISDLTHGFQKENRHGFDETVYLLLTGKLPTADELKEFSAYLASLRALPDSFINNMILSLKGKDVLNILARSVLGLYTLDEDPDNISLDNMIRQSLNLIAKFPSIIAYSYQALRHAYYGKTLSIRHPRTDLTTAENFLHLVKGDTYTKLQADMVDLALVLHAEHGGGNNSTFTMRVTSSTETDIYSAVTAAIGSLKGPLHGGANLKVLEMMENIKKNVKDWKDREEVSNYLMKILRKEANDHTGKIYGVGHAVYTISDPRAVLLKEKARELASESGRLDEFNLYCLVEELTPEIFKEFKNGQNDKTVCVNVDFYSGFVYSCIGIPRDLYTPLFAMSRIAGWCAHRIEELTFCAKRIIRPAFKNVYGNRSYVPIDERN
ncbi:MAG TPA: citrate/2-methylcitrate synthase [Bacteroidales bacterium]|nr:citrate/2-methylcitrate synthase [Bacteroidales bacterium]HCI54620.1 citrate synthase [Bacteroidales bacterium]HOU95580.1 citrate/2-methylcitrate synthase [Bacteroidales bacterium]HQG37004.1 citrate/2-methylcitrate synthase [Bacteroidales bacterium]HQG53154.1 citrate/2-methylcitrate synthase [Bacteroidales bacterium]